MSPGEWSGGISFFGSSVTASFPFPVPSLIPSLVPVPPSDSLLLDSRYGMLIQ